MLKAIPPPSSTTTFHSSLTSPSEHSQSQSQSDAQSHASEPRANSSRSSNVRVVVRIRPMNQSERERRSKTSLYPVVDHMTTSETETTQAEAAEATAMDENDPMHAAAEAPNQLANTAATTTPTKTPRKSFLSRLLTPTRKSNFGYSKPTTTSAAAAAVFKRDQDQEQDSNSRDLCSQATPVVKNTTLHQQHQQHSTIPQPQHRHSHRVISHPLASIQTPPRRSSIPSASSTTTAAAACSSCKVSTPAAAAAVATRLMAESSTPCTNTNNHNHSDTNSTTKHFDFDAVFGPTSSQAQVYQETVGDAVTRNIFRGFHTTIIAYGQTASGKTYTMGGPRDAKVLAGEAVTPCRSHQHQNVNQNASQHDTYQVEPDDGIIPRAIHDLFQAKRNQQHTGGQKVTVELTYLEIYNDELRDLLVETDADDGMTNNTNMTSPTPSNNNNFLELRDHGDKVGVAVTGLTKLRVESVDQAKALMEQATLRRTTGSTRLNERSSRSHAICTLLVTIEQPPNDGNGNGSKSRTRAGGSETITAKLTLVDLAGSERIKETGVVGIQKQESININKDLFVLGKVVSALSEKCKKGKGSKTHIPYRDSKLTRLLRDSIGGKCVV
jgi:hypothetical protein